MIGLFLFGQIGPYIPTHAHAKELSIQKSTLKRLSKVPFAPATLRGLTIFPDDPLRLDFIIDTGDNDLQGGALKTEANKLIKYFLTALTVPDEDFWVNLSPYEQDRIIPYNLGTTALGETMLQQDYTLKQITASLLHPDSPQGAAFWQRIYREAQAHYGTTDIPVETFHKVWIIPDKARVYAHQNSAMIEARHLKVMLEKDYLAYRAKKASTNPATESTDQEAQATSPIIRELIIPAIEREVNEGAHFAPLRQIYNAMILAVWYKRALQGNLLSQVYVDQNKIPGIEGPHPQAPQEIYQQYVKTFETGVFNFIREDINPVTQQLIPRKYFSGGIHGASSAVTIEPQNNPLTITHESSKGQLIAVSSSLMERTTKNLSIPPSRFRSFLKKALVWSLISLNTLGPIQASYAATEAYALRSNPAISVNITKEGLSAKRNDFSIAPAKFGQFTMGTPDEKGRPTDYYYLPSTDINKDLIPDIFANYVDLAYEQTGYPVDILSFQHDKFYTHHPHVQIIRDIRIFGNIFEVILPPYYDTNKDYSATVMINGWLGSHNTDIEAKELRGIETALSNYNAVEEDQNGTIVIKVNAGRENLFVNDARTAQNIGRFLKIMANYGVNLNSISLTGGSRGGIASLILAVMLQQHFTDITVTDVYAKVPPWALGLTTRFSTDTWADMGYVIEEVARLLSLSDTEATLANIRAFLTGHRSIEGADKVSPIGLYDNPDIASLLKAKGTHLHLSSGTNDSFIPYPLVLEGIGALKKHGYNFDYTIMYGGGHTGQGGPYEGVGIVYRNMIEDKKNTSLEYDPNKNTQEIRYSFEAPIFNEFGAITGYKTVKVTNELMEEFKWAHPNIFAPDVTAADLGFNAIFPKRINTDGQLEIDLTGKKGSSWELAIYKIGDNKEPDHLNAAFTMSGRFGEDNGRPELADYGDNWAALRFGSLEKVNPGLYKVVLTYDGYRAPEMFTPDQSPAAITLMPKGAVYYDVPQFAITTYGLSQIHPLLLEKNTDPTLDITFPNKQGPVGTPIQIHTRSIDPDGDAINHYLTYTNGNIIKKTPMTIDGNTITIQLTNMAIGKHPLMLTVTDGKGGEAVQFFDITVFKDGWEIRSASSSLEAKTEATSAKTSRAIDPAVIERATLSHRAASSSPTQPKPVGGIAFKEEDLDLQIRRDDNGIALPLAQQALSTMNIAGFLPLITELRPLQAPFILSEPLTSP